MTFCIVMSILEIQAWPFCCTFLYRLWFKKKKKQIDGLWLPCSHQVCQHHFPTVCVQFICLCQIWQFLQYFKAFHYCICYGDLPSVIFSVTIVFALGCHEPCWHESANLVDKYCVLWLLHGPAIPPIFLSLLEPLYFLRYKIRQINNPTEASKCPSYGRVLCLSLKKASKLAEEGM